MLYFSETDWTLPDIREVEEFFAAQYDMDQYETKSANLSKRAKQRLRQENREAVDAWHDAVKILREEDHYLLVMVR
jgi:hypothetical protein